MWVVIGRGRISGSTITWNREKGNTEEFVIVVVQCKVILSQQKFVNENAIKLNNYVVRLSHILSPIRPGKILTFFLLLVVHFV